MRAMLLGCVLAIAASGQWPDYPTPGLPRLANGKANLAAPAPRAQGHPDLSGVWQLQPMESPDVVQDYVAAPEFLNLGRNVAGGLPYQPWAAELVKVRSAAAGRDDPVATCKPAGLVRLLTFPPYRKIIQTPGVTVLLSERDVTFRQIFTDGRPLPSDPSPSWNGYSIGKWRGDTFVVETIGLRGDGWLDRAGSPMTDAAKITEVYRRKDVGHLDIELTINDPKAYTRPWTVVLHQLLVPDTDLLEYHCTDNEKDEAHVVR
jgi:hypothetical protein